MNGAKQVFWAPELLIFLVDDASAKWFRRGADLQIMLDAECHWQNCLY